MFRTVDRQTTFFDSEFWFGSLVPEDSMYGRMRKYGDVWFRDEDYAEMYKPSGLGRPCIPPSIMVKTLILQNYLGRSDREMADALRFDIRVKYGVDVPIDYEGFDASLLTVFRARLLANRSDRIAFDLSLEIAKASGILTKDEELALDSAPIIGAAALQDTYTLLRTGIEKTLRAIDWQRKAWEGSRGFQYPYKREKYLADRGKPDMNWDDEERKGQYLLELVTDARSLLAAIEASGMKESEVVQKAAEVLAQIIVQDIEENPVAKASEKADSKGRKSSTKKPAAETKDETGDSKSAISPEEQASESPGNQPSTESKTETKDDTAAPSPDAKPSSAEKPVIPIIKKATGSRIISTNDPEMRHGRKSKTKLVKGYKNHISTTLKTEIVTSVNVTPANVSDQEPVPGSLAQLESAGLKPKKLYGDGAYGSTDMRANLQSRGIEMVSQLPSQPSGARIGKRFFELNLVENSVTCPANFTTTNYRLVKDDKGREVKKFDFDKNTCQQCPQREACIGPKEKKREITLLYNEEQLQKARAQNDAPEFREEYKNRLVVERVQARLQSYGLRVARYFGRAKVELQALYAATANNFWRVTKILDSELALEGPS